MHIGRLRWIGKVAGSIEVVGVYLKDERRLSAGVMAHFDGVGSIVDLNAIDTVHREMFIRSCHGKRHNRQSF